MYYFLNFNIDMVVKKTTGSRAIAAALVRASHDMDGKGSVKGVRGRGKGKAEEDKKFSTYFFKEYHARLTEEEKLHAGNKILL